MVTFPKFPVKGTIPIVVTITNGINEGGAPNPAVTFVGTCFFDEKARTRRGGDGIDFVLSGIALIDGDIAPSIEKITGSVVIGAGPAENKIHMGRRIRDFSGEVHHTELELI